MLVSISLDYIIKLLLLNLIKTYFYEKTVISSDIYNTCSINEINNLGYGYDFSVKKHAVKIMHNATKYTCTNMW